LKLYGQEYIADTWAMANIEHGTVEKIQANTEHGTEHGTVEKIGVKKASNTGQSKKSESRKGWSAERWRGTEHGTVEKIQANTEHGTVEKIGVKKGLERRALAGAVQTTTPDSQELQSTL